MVIKRPKVIGLLLYLVGVLLVVEGCQTDISRKGGLSFDNYNTGLTSISSDEDGRWKYRLAAKDNTLLLGIHCSAFSEEMFEFKWLGEPISFRVNHGRTLNPRMGDYSATLAGNYLEIVPGGACGYVKFDFTKKLTAALGTQVDTDARLAAVEAGRKRIAEEARLASVAAERKAEEARLAELEAESKRREEARRLAEAERKHKSVLEKQRAAANKKAQLEAKVKKARRAKLVDGRKYDIALIIGNKSYSGGIPEADFAHNDADSMKRFVIDQLGYRRGNVINLRDTTKGQLEAVFGNENSHKAKLNNWVRANKSNVVVFYSGHGVPGLKDRRGYLLPVDADPNLVELNGYPVDTLYANLNKIPAKSITVYLDACFSGDSPKGMIVRATSGISVEAVAPKKVGKLVVLTAAQGDQFASWDEDAKLGLFTRHLLEALKGAADGEDFGNGDGKVTVAEAEKYLGEEMTYQARRRYNREQNPTVQGDPNYVLSVF